MYKVYVVVESYYRDPETQGTRIIGSYNSRELAEEAIEKETIQNEIDKEGPFDYNDDWSNYDYSFEILEKTVNSHD